MWGWTRGGIHTKGTIGGRGVTQTDLGLRMNLTLGPGKVTRLSRKDPGARGKVVRTLRVMVPRAMTTSESSPNTKANQKMVQRRPPVLPLPHQQMIKPT